MEEGILTVNGARDIGTVTTEINTLVAQYRSLTLAYGVEVGRRLCEAKSLLPHGEWGTWLAEKVSFSQRTANNLMRVFEEYGDSQITLFGAVPNSHAIANLPLTHAIKLLLLPAEEREEFTAENDVAAMSARELEAAIRAKKEAEERAAALEADNEDMDRQLSSMAQELKQEYDAVQQAKADADAARQEAEKAKTDAEKAKADAKKAKEKLKALKDSAEVPQDVLDKLAKEAEEKAAAAHAAKLEQANTEAAQRVQAAERLRAEAEAKYETLRQQAQLSDPDVMEFKALFQQVQDDAGKLAAAFGRVKEKNPELAGKLAAAVAKMAESAFGGIGV